MHRSFKKILNRMVSFERGNSDYFELGEFVDMIVNQIPYFRLKNMVESMRKWDLNSLKLADRFTAIDILRKQFNNKTEILNEDNCERTFLYPINIICQLIDFLYLYQNRENLFRKKVKISLGNDKRHAVCKIFTDINSSDHWFTKKDDEIWSMVRQYTSAINLHSFFVEVERLGYEDRCLILIKFDMHRYYEEERSMLEIVKKEIELKDVSDFKKNAYHVLFNMSGKDFIKLVDSRIITNKKNSLYREVNLMDRLRDLRGFPCVKKYTKIGHYEMFIADNIKGKTLDEYLSDNNNDMEVSLLFKLYDQIRKINQNFIVHRDLKSSNIIISDSNDLNIIDFDQASIAIDISNKFDLRMSKFSRFSSLYSISRTLEASPKVKDRIHNIQMKLNKLWIEAAASESNSPGRNVAYYSYSFGDVDYTGERDFFERWILLEKSRISFKDKYVVELGCNIGFFGAYSALYGAKNVMSFDIDSKIIQCAKGLSEIMELKNIKHEVRNLNHKDAFRDIKEIDFMFALSVYFWLEDTAEFDRLMRIAKEVMYEGHEQYDCEYGRLREWGFEEIKTVGITDRLRTIFYARK